MAISKLILNGVTQMDVTSDTVAANKLLNGETATKNDGTKVTGNIASKTSSDLTVSGATVTAPAGYYASNASKAISNGTQGTPSFNRSTGTNSTTLTPVVVNTAGYINGGTRTGTAVTISASDLVSGTYTVDSSGTKDVTNYASISVPSGTAGTPTATKGTVSNHSVSVTPSVTNTTGYITGSTKTGTAVSVSASELVDGSLSITSNGTANVTNYASATVNVTPRLQAKTVDPSDQIQVITPDTATEHSVTPTRATSLSSSPLTTSIDLSFLEYGKRYSVSGQFSYAHNYSYTQDFIYIDTIWTASDGGSIDFTQSTHDQPSDPEQITLSKTQLSIYMPSGTTISRGSIANTAATYNLLNFTCIDDSYEGLSQVTVNAATAAASWITITINSVTSNASLYTTILAATSTEGSVKARIPSVTTYRIPPNPSNNGYGILAATGSNLGYWPNITAVSGTVYTIDTSTSGSTKYMSSWQVSDGAVINVTTSDRS